MDTLHTVADHVSDLCQVVTCVLFLVKPFREWLMGTKQIQEGHRCLLRSEAVRIYYRHLQDKQLREYEFRNLEQCYLAYKALGGNSFIDRIYAEMQEWEII